MSLIVNLRFIKKIRLTASFNLLFSRFSWLSFIVSSRVFLFTFLPSLLSVLFSAAILAQVSVYPRVAQTPFLPSSPYYQVEVSQNNKTYLLETFYSKANVGIVDNMNRHFKDNSISWVHFSFNQPVTIKVKLLNRTAEAQQQIVSVLPSKANIKVTRLNQDTVQFTLSEAGQYSVELGETGFKHGLMIFADPPEKNVPDPNDKDVLLCSPCNESMIMNNKTNSTLYFAPGVHVIGAMTVPENIKQIYIAGGAFLRGGLYLMSPALSKIKIHGRGHIDGSYFDGARFDTLHAAKSVKGVEIEGIILSQSAHYSIRLLSDYNQVNGIKTIASWLDTTDGFVGRDNTNLTNSFIWANGSAIKLHDNNIKLNNVNIWVLSHGSVFNFAWTKKSARNISVSNVNVFHGQWEQSQRGPGVFNLRGKPLEKGLRYMLDWRFENITIETPVNALFLIKPLFAHRMKNIVFKNIFVRANPDFSNRIEGISARQPITGLTIENLIINDVCITTENAKTLGNFSLKYTRDINFIGDCLF